MREFFDSVEIFLYPFYGDGYKIYTSKTLKNKQQKNPVLLYNKKVNFTLCKCKILKTF